MIRAQGINGKKVKLHTTARSKIVPVLLSTVYHIPEVVKVTPMRIFQGEYLMMYSLTFIQRLCGIQ